MSERDYYCSRKFTELTVNLENRSVASCCSADFQRINFDNLKSNNIANIDFLVNDRTAMLNNQAVDSCREYCWNLEDIGQLSVRQTGGTNIKTHQSTKIDNLNSIDIVIGSRCNLTCSYCCKNYSRSWLQDIVKNGSYDIKNEGNKYSLTAVDHVVKNLSQSNLYSGQNFELLLKSITDMFGSVSNIQITGGEPFLYDFTFDLIKIIPPNVQVTVFTGAGIDVNKFSTKLDELKLLPNLKIAISAENIGQFYEFNRFGNSFENFNAIVQLIKQSGIRYSFTSVLSNLTIFGFIDFLKYADAPIKQQFCNSPAFMNITVVDEYTKSQLLEVYKDQHDDRLNVVIQNLENSTPCSEFDRKNLSTFFKEFASRRNLDTGIFPSSFQKWIDT
jgi:MoaA/NifB/PqqE/SkfB family radical SAM enzyme